MAEPRVQIENGADQGKVIRPRLEFRWFLLGLGEELARVRERAAQPAAAM